MNKQMTKREEEIVAMDFGFMDNHGFTSVIESDYISGFGYCKVYESKAMEALGLRLEVNIGGIFRKTYGTWSIEYYCYIVDNYGSIRERFSLYSQVHSEQYYEAWTTDDGGYRDRDAYDMLFSQLDEDRLHEKCMGYVERLGESEQERIAANYSL